MMKSIDPVPPGVCPVVIGKSLLKPGGSTASPVIKSSFVKDQGEFTIGYLTIILKK
jgi:hypothetical protein